MLIIFRVSAIYLALHIVALLYDVGKYIHNVGYRALPISPLGPE